MKPGLRAFALTLALARTLLPVTSFTLGKASAGSRKSNKTGLLSLGSHLREEEEKKVANVATNAKGKLNGHAQEEKEIVNIGTNIGGMQSGSGGHNLEAASLMAEDSEGSRRRSRRRRRRRRRRRKKKSKSARRRRRRAAEGGSRPAPRPAAPTAKKADAKVDSIEAGWGDMAKMGEYFTLFISGSSLDPEKDRALVIHGEDACGSGSSRIATVLGSGDVPSGLAGWKSLKCNGLTSGSSKLACGDGESGGDGVLFPDDKWVDTYNFKVCVCDYSKKNQCSSKADFDVAVSKPLKVNPVV